MLVPKFSLGIDTGTDFDTETEVWIEVWSTLRSRLRLGLIIIMYSIHVCMGIEIGTETSLILRHD